MIPWIPWIYSNVLPPHRVHHVSRHVHSFVLQHKTFPGWSACKFTRARFCSLLDATFCIWNKSFQHFKIHMEIFCTNLYPTLLFVFFSHNEWSFCCHLCLCKKTLSFKWNSPFCVTKSDQDHIIISVSCNFTFYILFRQCSFHLIHFSFTYSIYTYCPPSNVLIIANYKLDKNCWICRYLILGFIHYLTKISLNIKLYLFYNNNTQLQIGHKVILLGGEY